MVFSFLSPINLGDEDWLQGDVMISYKSGVKSFNNLIIVIPILVYEIIVPVVSLFLLVRSFRNNQLYKRLT